MTQRYKVNILFALIVPAAFLSLCSCNGKDAKAVWKDVVFKCANSDLLGNDVIYFGPSNNYGPGTVFESGGHGGWYPEWPISRYISAPQNVLHEGPVFSCSGQSTSNWNIGGSFLLGTVLNGSGEFSKARKVVVAVDSIRQDDLDGGPFRAEVNKLSPDNQPRKDLESPNFRVIRRAFLIRGLTADLEFDSSVGGDVKHNLPDNSQAKPQGNGDWGISLSVKWQGNTKLHLTSTSDFYVAGEMWTYNNGGLAAGSDVFGRIEQGVYKTHVLRMKPQ